jgi:hypothetical protein
VSGILTISSQVYSTSCNALEAATGYYAFRIMDCDSYGLVGLEHVIGFTNLQERNRIYTLGTPSQNSDVRP